MNRYNRLDKPDWVPPRSNRLLDQVRERVRYLHYSLQTEKAYVYWAKAFVLRAARSGGSFRHLREMGQADVEGFLTMLAVEKRVSPATHRQALNALLFLYRQVLGMELTWLQQMGEPAEHDVPVGLLQSRYPATAFARSWYSSHPVPPHRRCSACRCSRALAGCFFMR